MKNLHKKLYKVVKGVGYILGLLFVLIALLFALR